MNVIYYYLFLILGVYCIFPFSYSDSYHENGQDFSDIQYIQYLLKEFVFSATAFNFQPVQGLPDFINLILDELDRIYFMLDGYHVSFNLTNVTLAGFHTESSLAMSSDCFHVMVTS